MFPKHQEGTRMNHKGTEGQVVIDSTVELFELEGHRCLCGD